MNNNITKVRFTSTEKESQAVLNSAFLLQNQSSNQTTDKLLLNLAEVTNGGLNIHKVPIATETKSAGEETTLETAAIQKQVIGMPPVKPTREDTPTASQAENEAALDAAQWTEQLKEGLKNPNTGITGHLNTGRTEQEQESPKTKQKKSLLDRIKEKPFVYVVIAVILVFIGYKLYKSKNG